MKAIGWKTIRHPSLKTVASTAGIARKCVQPGLKIRDGLTRAKLTLTQKPESHSITGPLVRE